jgi:hypothetical protein
MSSNDASTSSFAEGASVFFQISHQGKRHSLRVESSTTLGSLQEEIAELTRVDATHQKLLVSGPLRPTLAKAKENEAKTVKELKLVSDDESRPVRIMVVGPTDSELDSVQRGDLEAEKRNRPRQYHPSMLRGGKVSHCSERVSVRVR